MRIPKKVAYLVSAAFSILLVSGLVFYFNFNKTSTEKLECLTFTELYSIKNCGYISIFTNKNIHKVAGVIKSKNKNNNKYTFDLLTLDSKGKRIILPVRISEDPIPKRLSVITPFKFIGKERVISKNLPVSSSKELYDSLDVNDEIIINILIENESEILKAKKAFGNIKELTCSYNHRLAVDYLKESNFMNYIKFQFNSNTSGCDIYTLHIEKVRT